jgi:hypothetical protein
MIPLFPNETNLFHTKTASSEFWLTNCRLRQGFPREFTSMLLEEVCSIRTARRHHPWLLIVAAVLGILAGYNGIQAATAPPIPALIDRSQTIAFCFLLASLVFIAAYFISRRTAIEIASAAARMIVTVRDMATLVEQIERAKNERYLMMRSGSCSGP